MLPEFDVTRVKPCPVTFQNKQLVAPNRPHLFELCSVAKYCLFHDNNLMIGTTTKITCSVDVHFYRPTFVAMMGNCKN